MSVARTDLATDLVSHHTAALHLLKDQFKLIIFGIK